MAFTDFFFSYNLLKEDNSVCASDSSSDGTCTMCAEGVDGLFIIIGARVIGVEVGVVTFASSIVTLVP